MPKRYLTNTALVARHKEIRVISPYGKNLGVMLSTDALKLAKQFDLDIIEINGAATPPVCKIDDIGKVLYEEGKVDTKQPTRRPKEIDLSARIETNDFNTKINRAKTFLYDGHQVQIVLKFRGREMQHKEIGFDIMRRVGEELGAHGRTTSPIKLVGRNITVTFSPRDIQPPID